MSVQFVPDSYDLRNVDGINYVTSIKNHKNCGSCVAFGVLATVEASAHFQSKDPHLAIDLSEAQLFFYYGYNEGVNCSTGWWPIYTYENFQTQGIVDESCYNYNTVIEKYTNLKNLSSQMKK